MNKEDRKQVQRIVSELQGLAAELDELRGQEQDKYDNMSEGFQQSAMGEEIGRAAEALEFAATGLGEAIDELESIA